MSRAVCLALSACFCVSLLPNSARAQGDALMELYGEGVHRFFAGDLMEAEVLLTRVIDSGSQDPRAYYFRGLVRECQGGGGEFDFEEGARLEAEGKLSVPVGDSLSRIQGHLRSKIEKARRDARIAYRQQQQAMNEMRRNTLDETPGVTESPGVQAPEEGVPPVPSVTEDEAPFEEGMRSGDTTEDEVQPTAPEIDATTDPFADDPAPMPDAPAAEEPAAPAADPFGEAPAADPFGGDAGASDPFGAPDAGADAPAADPFGGDATQPAPGADPFGGSGDTPGGAADPFGGDDPFGNG